MKRLIVASNNEHKIEEIKAMLSQFPLEVVSLKEAGINVDVEEDGTTFMENSYKKAIEIYNINKKDMVLADDSGLMVDALNGAPGVFSARFAGEHGNNQKNNEKLMELMQGKENRNAKFVCAMVLIINDIKVIRVQGEAHGVIVNEERGAEGFGYDPLFYVPEKGMTFAEMGAEAKNKISHRSKALDMLKKELEKQL